MTEGSWFCVFGTAVLVFSSTVIGGCCYSEATNRQHIQKMHELGYKKVVERVPSEMTSVSKWVKKEE